MIHVYWQACQSVKSCKSTCALYVLTLGLKLIIRVAVNTFLGGKSAVLYICKHTNIYVHIDTQLYIIFRAWHMTEVC
jgi:hypothetical protein